MGSYYDKARVNGIYEPDRLRPIDADRLAWECNALPPGAILSRLGKTDSEVAKVQLKRARAYLEADLDALKEAGMGGAWEKKKTHGKGFAVLPVPPEEYGEACKRMADAVRKNQKSKGRR